MEFTNFFVICCAETFIFDAKIENVTILYRVIFYIFSFAISRKKYIFAVVKHLNLNDMKKIFLGLWLL
jgi:hypothetical protein